MGREKKSSSKRVSMIAGSVIYLLLGTPVFAQVSGAIFTSDKNGVTPNGNNYALKSDVYLNGGPPAHAPCTAAGLPDGTYYFQVTDPSGATLLSTDPVANRQVTVTGGVITSASTHATGSGVCGAASVQLMPFSNTPNPGCVYKVWLSQDQTFPNSLSKTDNFKTCDTDSQGPEPGSISALKFYDSNTDGQLTQGEVPIPGWQVDSDSGIARACTDTNGIATFSPVAPSISYTLTEIPPPPGFVPNPGAIWVPTTAISGTTQVGGAQVVFGNVCVGKGGGLTLGFWSNKNGQSLETAADFALLTGIKLVNSNGSSRDFTDTLANNKSALNSWLLSATATNMANMLSAQLTAMELNVSHTLVNSNALVYAGPFPVACTNLALGLTPANPAGFIKISDLMNDANTTLGIYNSTASAGDARTCEEYLKTTLDKGNNNLNFVQAGPSSCPIVACPYAN